MKVKIKFRWNDEVIDYAVITGENRRDIEEQIDSFLTNRGLSWDNHLYTKIMEK